MMHLLCKYEAKRTNHFRRKHHDAKHRFICGANFMHRKVRFIEKSLMRSIRLFSGGGGRIRTIEAIRSRFTVCPLWPLGNSPIFDSDSIGAGRRTRTPDLLITNQLLYQLSYTGGSTERAYYTTYNEKVKHYF